MPKNNLIFDDDSSLIGASSFFAAGFLGLSPEKPSKKRKHPEGISSNFPYSPLRAHYKKALKDLTEMDVDYYYHGGLLDSIIVNSLDDPRFREGDDRLILESIRGFVGDFLSTGENVKITTDAYDAKVNAIIAEHQERIAALDELCGLLESDLEDLVPFITRWRNANLELTNNSDLKDIADSVNEFIECVNENASDDDFIHSLKVSLLKELTKTIRKLDKLSSKQHQKLQSEPDDPMTVSFCVLNDKCDNKNKVVIATSSPEHNVPFITALNEYIGANAEKYHVSYQIAETASRDMLKLIHQVARVYAANSDENIGNIRKPLKKCAEKSIVATKIKLQHDCGSELSVRFILSLAFYPRSGLEQTDKMIDIAINNQKATMMVKPPCGDCQKCMPAIGLLMSEAPVISPIRRPRQGIGQVVADAGQGTPKQSKRRLYI